MTEKCYCVVETDKNTHEVRNIIQICFSITEAQEYIENFIPKFNQPLYIIWPSFYEDSTPI